MSNADRLTASQKQAVDYDGKLLISAAAGSGKTTTMLEKILDLVGRGMPLKRVLVLTYNNAGADELNERLYSGLFERACQSNGSERELYRNGLDELSFCNVGTIHGFCAKLIRENFEKLSLSPTFTVLDETRNASYMRRALDNVFEKYFEENDALFSALSEVFAQGRREDNLRSIVIKLFTFIDIQPDKECFYNTVKQCFVSVEGTFKDVIIEDIGKKMRASVAECTEIYEILLALGQQNYAEAVFKTKLAAKKVSACRTLKELIEIAPENIVKNTARRKPNSSDDIVYWTERAKTVIKVTANEIQNISEVFADYEFIKIAHSQNSAFIEKLLETAERFSEELTRLKRKDLVLSFSDLEHEAVRLVKEGVADGMFDYVFVDEYQDVNPTQEFIINALIKDKCFIVGDVKQSIYGFRLADPNIFLKREKIFEAEGKTIGFKKNFRSEESILNFVNAVFDTVMTKSSADVDYINDARFETEYGKIADNVQLHLFCSEKKEREKPKGVYDIKSHVLPSETENASESEGAFIGSEIKSLVGRAMSGDGGKKIEYGDIAVLLRSRGSGAQKIIASLKRAGIPLDDGGFSGGEAPEKELLQFLKAIDNPRQDIPFAGFLLSFFGGYTEEELAVIAGFDGSCLYDKFVAAAKSFAVDNQPEYKVVNNAVLSAEDSKKDGAISRCDSSYNCTPSNHFAGECLSCKINGTLNVLTFYRKKAYLKSVAELMDGIVSDYLYDAYLAKRGEGEVSGLNAFISAAAQSEELSLGKFLSQISDTDSKNERFSASGGNRVKISTFHGFKGLEAPVVFVADTSSTFSAKTGSGDLICNGNGYIGLNYFDLKNKTKAQSLSVNAVKRMIRDRELKEEMRLFYVALTRPKSYLYVTAAVTGGKLKEFGLYPRIEDASCNLDFISDAVFAGNLKVTPTVHVSGTYAADNKPIGGSVLLKTDKEIERAISEGQSFKYKFAGGTRISRKYSVSALDGGDETSASIYGPAAAEGTAYHRVMEHIDFEADTAVKVEHEIRAMAAAGILSAAEAATVDAAAIAKCLNSDIMRLARKSVCLREKKFMMYIPASEASETLASDDRVLVQGIADLIILGDEMYIVDFKNSRLTDANTLNKYKKQLELYKRAVEASDSDRKYKIALYSFKTGKTLVFD